MVFMVLAFCTYIAAVSSARLTPSSMARLTSSSTRGNKTVNPLTQYTYGYEVQDTLTGDSKNQVERRRGEVIQGQYSLNDADGYRRIVDYTADPVKGFKAIIRREPLKAVQSVARPLKSSEIHSKRISTTGAATASQKVSAKAKQIFTHLKLPTGSPKAVRHASAHVPVPVSYITHNPNSNPLDDNAMNGRRIFVPLSLAPIAVAPLMRAHKPGVIIPKNVSLAPSDRSQDAKRLRTSEGSTGKPAIREASIHGDHNSARTSALVEQSQTFKPSTPITSSQYHVKSSPVSGSTQSVPPLPFFNRAYAGVMSNKTPGSRTEVNNSSGALPVSPSHSVEQKNPSAIFRTSFSSPLTSYAYTATSS